MGGFCPKPVRSRRQIGQNPNISAKFMVDWKSALRGSGSMRPATRSAVTWPGARITPSRLKAELHNGGGGRLETGDTADWKSALRGWCRVAPEINPNVKRRAILARTCGT